MIDINERIKKEFEKYGLEPFKVEEIGLKNIESSVLKIVAEHLFNSVREINFHTEQKWRDSESIKEWWNDSVLVRTEEKELLDGVFTLIAIKKVWLNKNLIKSAAGNIELSHWFEEARPPADDSSKVMIKLNDGKIFSAKWGWDSVDEKSIEITATPTSKNAFQIISKKAKQIIKQ